MISTFFITIVFSFINGLLSLLPTGSLPVAIITGVAYFMGILNTFNYLFPIDTLVAVLGFALIFHSAWFFWGLYNYIYGLLRR